MNHHCYFFQIIVACHVKSAVLMNHIFHKMIRKNCSYFLFFLHSSLYNIFIFFIFCFISLTVIAGKEIDTLKNEKKGYDDKNVAIDVYNQSKLCVNSMTCLENGTVFCSSKNDLLKLPEKNIAIPLSLVPLIKMMPLKKEFLFLKKIISFDAKRPKQNNSCLFDFFYKIEHLYSFLMCDDKNIKFIMEHVYYVHIIEVFRFCGFPSIQVVKHVRTWVNLEKGYTLNWLWKNLSLHFKEQGIPNKHVFFSLIAEMEKEIELPSQMSNYLSEFEKRWFLVYNARKDRHKDDWCMVQRKLSNFFLFLSLRHINISVAYLTKMKHFNFERLISFCDKCKCFYENRPETWSIASFFINTNYAAEKLLKYNYEDIKFIATHPFYKDILALYRAREFPPAAIVRTVDTCWINIQEGITQEWIWNNLALNFKSAGIPEKEVFFSQVAGIERNVEVMHFYQIIEYGLKKEKRDNNQKCSDAYNERNIDKAHELLVLLARKKIDDVLSFIDILLELDTDKISYFCNKIMYFYSTAKEKRSIIPIFLDSMEKVYLFLENSREDIEFIAQHSVYPLIEKVYFGVNFPIASCVKKAEAWRYSVGGKEISSVELWTLLAKMFTSCGVPTKEQFFLEHLKLSHSSDYIHEKKQKEKLALQKINPTHNKVLLFLSSDHNMLKGDSGTNEVKISTQRNDFCSKKSAEKIGELLVFLIKKRIENIALVIELVLQLLAELDDNAMANFCDKMMYFYSNTEDKRSLIPSFLNSIEKVNLFLMNTNEEIEFIARHPCYSKIYEVYFGVGFPSVPCVKKFDTWEKVVKNITLVSLWKLLAEIFPGYGAPKRGTFLLHCCELSYKQHNICEKNQVNELTLQEKKSNCDNVLLALSLNIDTLNKVKRINKISNDAWRKRSDVWDEKVIDTINTLLTFLAYKNIENIHSFMDIILKLSNYHIGVFCSKVRLFYENSEEKRAIVIIFLNSIEKVGLFLYENNKKNIKFIAQHSQYPYISEVYRGVNFPNLRDVEIVDLWENSNKNKPIIFLWKLLAMAFSGYGMPSKEMFFFFCFCCEAIFKKNKICEKK